MIKKNGWEVVIWKKTFDIDVDRQWRDYIIDIVAYNGFTTRCVGLLSLWMNKSAYYKAFFNAVPHLSVLEQLKSVYDFQLRFPV